jgi:hypothetical protein
MALLDSVIHKSAYNLRKSIQTLEQVNPLTRSIYERYYRHDMAQEKPN